MKRGMVAAIVAALALGGCSGSRVIGGEPGTSNVWLDASYAFNGRQAPVQLIGDPFGGDRAVLERAVERAMRGRAFGIDTVFTTHPDTSSKDRLPRGDQRVVFAFSPLGAEPTSRICRQPTIATGPAVADGGRLYAEAALCDGGGMISVARGWLDPARGPESDGFHDLIADLTHTLFAPPNESSVCDVTLC